MATQLFLRGNIGGSSNEADTHRGTNTAKLNGSTSGWQPLALGTSRGSSTLFSANVPTVTGPTSGVEITGSTNFPLEWLSPPVSADVTISGTITANIWAAESSMNANVAINVVIDILRANSFGADGSNEIVQIAKSTFVTELGTTRSANNFTTGMTSGGYTAQTLNRGDRLRIRVFGDDSTAATMASGFTFNMSWNGTTAAADGDCYVTFTENFSFEGAPGGTVVYLTDAHPGLSGAPALLSAFTGADENPLSEGGNWAQLDSSGTAMRRISNAAAATVATTSGSYWTPGDFGPDLEAYVTCTAVIGVVAGILVRVQGAGGAGTFDGYSVEAHTSTITIRRWDNSVATTLLSVTGGIAAGDKIGIRCVGSSIQSWHQPSGSSTWDLVGTVVDTTYASAGKIAIKAQDTTTRLDDLYAATGSNLFTQKAWTSRGAGVVSYRSDTDAGFLTPLLAAEWFTPQLQAVTLGGMAVANIRALESAAGSFATLRMEIARVASDGTSPTVWGSWCVEADNARIGELNTSEAAETVNISGDDLAITDGQRLRIRLYIDDMPTTALVTARTVTTFYNGTSGGASGDSYITFPVTLTEFSAGGGTTYTDAGYGAAGLVGAGASAKVAGAAAGPAFRRQRRASRYLTFR